MARRNWVWEESYIQRPWRRLYPNIFNFQFRNLLYASGRNSTYLCFEVECWEQGSFIWSTKGVFRNQEDSSHAELCFLNWFCDRIESPDAEYHVTWYTSWSPCFDCAEEVAAVLCEHENVSLSIFAARLYRVEPADDQGLRALQGAGAQVAMMSPEDFEYCWNIFVYNGGKNFSYWRNVRRHYYILQEQLNSILCKDAPLTWVLPSHHMNHILLLN
uniref:Apolipoprotein B mRNA editing enzyme catalytic subunit 3C n=1 Tax=Molossus molossus TaxID=27622 RepID=A0A7J8FVF7_MOLMO|nr:apolipoprotein B mRNA editing enzyme catalytic subunit 3C [Molossus molossus]